MNKEKTNEIKDYNKDYTATNYQIKYRILSAIAAMIAGIIPVIGFLQKVGSDSLLIKYFSYSIFLTFIALILLFAFLPTSIKRDFIGKRWLALFLIPFILTLPILFFTIDIRGISDYFLIVLFLLTYFILTTLFMQVMPIKKIIKYTIFYSYISLIVTLFISYYTLAISIYSLSTPTSDALASIVYFLYINILFVSTISFILTFMKSDNFEAEKREINTSIIIKTILFVSALFFILCIWQLNIGFFLISLLLILPIIDKKTSPSKLFIYFLVLSAIIPMIIKVSLAESFVVFWGDVYLYTLF